MWFIQTDIDIHKSPPHPFTSQGGATREAGRGGWWNHPPPLLVIQVPVMVLKLLV